MEYVRSAVQGHTSLMKSKEADYRTQTKETSFTVQVTYFSSNSSQSAKVWCFS